jgi:hypothetical protein
MSSNKHLPRNEPPHACRVLCSTTTNARFWLLTPLPWIHSLYAHLPINSRQYFFRFLRRHIERPSALQRSRTRHPRKAKSNYLALTEYDLHNPDPTTPTMRFLSITALALATVLPSAFAKDDDPASSDAAASAAEDACYAKTLATGSGAAAAIKGFCAQV